MCIDAISSTNKCDYEHVTLSLFKQFSFRLGVKVNVLPLSLRKEETIMLKIVYPICCGIDVHKTFVIACIASTNTNNETSFTTRRFSTFSKGLRQLSTWLSENNCAHVCMESTGKYWIPVHNVLEQTVSVVLAHPKYVRAIRGKKTDVKDAQWIADLFKHDLVRPSFIPTLEIRQLRDLCRYRAKLVNTRSSEKNRLQNILSTSNIQLASVVTDITGKSSLNIIHAFLHRPLTLVEDLPSLIHGRLSPKIPDIIDAMDGYMLEQQKSKLRIVLTQLENLNTTIALLEDEIIKLALPFTEWTDLLLSVPGFKSNITVITVLSEISNDMSQFPSAKHLCSWAGLTPQNNESAGKKKSVRISKAGAFLKPLLIQCALGVIASSKYPEFKNHYIQLKKRRGHKKALVAVARKIITAIYHMFTKMEEYVPFVHENFVRPKHQTISIKDAIIFAESNGFKVATE